LSENQKHRETITFSTFAEDFWNADGTFAQGRIARGFTLSNGYLEIAEGYTRNHLAPVWDSFRLQELTPGKIDTWIVRLRKDGNLAPATVNKLLQTLRAILGQAVAEGFLVRRQRIWTPAIIF
jgi:hypothetical protein